MQRDQVGFEASYRRHLGVEQRRAILEALADELDPDTTIGEVLDAAAALGWGDQMGDLNLADLGEALLDADAPADGEAEGLDAAQDELDGDGYELDEDEAEDEDEDYDLDEEDEEDEVVEDESATRARRKKATKKKAAKKASKTPSKRATKKTAKKTSKKTSRKTSKRAAKKTSKKKTARRAASKGRSRAAAEVEEEDDDERMSLDRAAEVLVPLLEELGQATMQDLEASTGMGRRKLRFHVGQLVKHGYLERHGMGRGTYYTTC